MKTWYRLRAARKTAELLIYDEIGSWGKTAAGLLNELAALGEITDLAVRINSPGGDAFEALAIHNALIRHPARVTAHADALCASAATIVALAADEVRMADNASWMIHDAWTVMAGNAAQLQKTADRLDTLSEQIATLYARKTGAEPEQVRDWMRAETWYTADQALAAGFIDGIDAPQKMAALATHDLSRFKNPPLAIKDHVMTAELAPTAPDEETQTPDAPAMPPAPEACNPLALSELCLNANEPGLIPHLLKTPHTPAEAEARIAQAKAVRQVCAIAKTPELADGLIANGATVDQAKLITWNTLVARDEATPINTTPPERRPASMKIAEFQKLTAQARAEYCRAGGKIID